MDKAEIKDWLLSGDVAIQYQARRDLADDERSDLRARIGREGWGAGFLALRNSSGHWGQSFYRPKWTCSHYTLLDLRNLNLSSEYPQVGETIELVLEQDRGRDGGINPSRHIGRSDVCINGMFLNYASYFGAAQEELAAVVDFILSQRMPDGGFNCRLNGSGARHSSLHSTLSVAEGIASYAAAGYTYRLDELRAAEAESIEFILLHRLYLSDRTGEVINKNFLRLPYPSRWKYDVLRALDYLRAAGIGFDERMRPAIEQLLAKRGKDGRWKVQAKHPGQTHFVMERAGQASRWNTLRAMRVLRHFQID